MLEYQLPSTALDNEHSPLDVDLMDATFYLGQDSQPSTSDPRFAGSNGVDFYEKYWDNLMLLGGDQPFIDVSPGCADHGHVNQELQ